ncbi:hypothetical protein F5Y16DRAFT_187079 [Xylariaceae sp. FL0255]|nr:hypothetical protein F5Y16DRAFT_187079 [Xylariaceae sp. FL0255]
MSANLQKDAASEAGVLGLFRRGRVAPKPLPADIRLTGRTAIVTGSNVGLGLEACRQLLSRGLSRLIMGVRSQAKGDAAADKIRQDFPDATVSVWIVDMESYSSIQKFSKKCEALEGIDVVILNAGLVKMAYETVEATGHEVSSQVNYLSTALLTILPLPILKARKAKDSNRPPVLNIVGSDIIYSAKWEKTDQVLKALDKSDKYSGLDWYGKAKLLLTFFTTQLAERISPSDVLINMSNPGATRGTSFGREAPFIVTKLFNVYQRAIGSKTPEQGASVYLDAALTRGAESRGSFISEWAIRPYPEIWYTEEGRELASKLWEETLTELDFAGARQIVTSMQNVNA